MILKDLINRLKLENPENILIIGFDTPYYEMGMDWRRDKITFTVKNRVKISDMLKDCIKVCNPKGKTYEIMNDSADIYLEEKGVPAIDLSERLLDYMLKDIVK